MAPHMRYIKVGDTLHVFVGTGAAAEKLIKKTLRAGGSVIENGNEQWIEITAIERPGTQFVYASDRYHWHADGNRVECHRTLVTKYGSGGGVHREHLSRVFRDLNSVT